MKTLGMFMSKAFARLMLCTLILMLGLATTVHGCACCAEPGTWFQENRKSDAEVLSIVGDLQRRLGGTAAVFVTAAGLEDVRGIDRAVEDYTLKPVASRAREWKLEFVDEKGNRGTLSFMVPKAIVSFGADPRDEHGGGGPLLYKEWRLQGPVTGSGIFKRGVTAGARFRLVLQGRGNMCAAAEDFKSWILQVKGPRADFSFHGQFKHPGNTSGVTTFADGNRTLMHPASPIGLKDKGRAAIDGGAPDVHMLSVRPFRKSKHHGKI